MTPDCRESKRQNVDPALFSISNDIDSNRHMWKKVLYWIVERPGWWRKEQYMKFLGSVETLEDMLLSMSSPVLSPRSSLSFMTSILYSPVSWSSYPSIRMSKKEQIVAFSVSSLLMSTAQNNGWSFGFEGFGKLTRSIVT